MQNKIVSIALAAVTLSFGIYAYNFPPIKDGVKPKGPNIKPPFVNDNQTCADYSSELKSKLSNGLVHDMVQMYRNNQLVNIQSSQQRIIRKDAQSIWFDLDTIKKFIYHFEHDIQQNSTYANNKRGIRIYYAAYPADIESWKGNTEYKGIAFMATDPSKKLYEKKHTLVMIPTLQNSAGKICDINLFDPSTFANGINRKENVNVLNVMKASYRPKPLYSLGTAPSNTANRTAAADQIAARNHGNLTPPALNNTGF